MELVLSLVDPRDQTQVVRPACQTLNHLTDPQGLFSLKILANGSFEQALPVCSEAQDGLRIPELSIVFWSPKYRDCRHEPSRLKKVVIGAWRESSAVKCMYLQRT